MAEAELSRGSYDHEGGEKDKIGINNNYLIKYNPFQLTGETRLVLFSYGVIHRKNDRNPEEISANIRARIPLGTIGSGIDLNQLKKDLTESTFRILRCMGERESFMLVPVDLQGEARNISELTKHECFFNSCSYCPEMFEHRYSSELMFRVCGLTATVVGKPEGHQVLKHPVWHGLGGQWIVGLGVELCVQGSNTVMISIMVPMGIVRAKKNGREGAQEIITHIQNAHPKVGLGGIGGVSVHIQFLGTIHKRLRAGMITNRMLFLLAEHYPQINFLHCSNKWKIASAKVVCQSTHYLKTMKLGTIVSESDLGGWKEK